MSDFEREEDAENQKEMDRRSALLCFVVFVLIGYLLTHFLPR
jgi:hypothetical protein